MARMKEDVETVESLKKQIEELKKSYEEEALKKVCEATGADLESVKDHKPKAPEQMLEFNIGPAVVNLNGTIYTGRGVAPRGVVEMLLEAASKKRQRLLNETIGKNYEVQQFAQGGFTSKLVSVHNPNQEVV